jgi:hypothetical protein
MCKNGTLERLCRSLFLDHSNAAVVARSKFHEAEICLRKIRDLFYYPPDLRCVFYDLVDGKIKGFGN